MTLCFLLTEEAPAFMHLSKGELIAAWEWIIHIYASYQCSHYTWCFQMLGIWKGTLVAQMFVCLKQQSTITFDTIWDAFHKHWNPYPFTWILSLWGQIFALISGKCYLIGLVFYPLKDIQTSHKLYRFLFHLTKFISEIYRNLEAPQPLEGQAYLITAILDNSEKVSPKTENECQILLLSLSLRWHPIGAFLLTPGHLDCRRWHRTIVENSL